VNGTVTPSPVSQQPREGVVAVPSFTARQVLRPEAHVEPVQAGTQMRSRSLKMFNHELRPPAQTFPKPQVDSPLEAHGSVQNGCGYDVAEKPAVGSVCVLQNAEGPSEAWH
jgi:hypothetical protein